MEKADLVLYSNAIFDSIGDEPFPGGVAVSGDKIRFVGVREDIEAFIGPDTNIRDFGDRMIMPGICDGHAHFIGTSTRYYAEVVSGLDKCKSEKECVEMVQAFAAGHPGLKRIYGTGWLLPGWGANPVAPTKASLDKSFPDTPVYLQGTDGHSFWLNSRAIEECGLEEIVRQNPDVPPEYAPRDENGDFTGFLAERICFIVTRFAETYTREQIRDFQVKTAKRLNSYGITGFTDVSPMPADSLIDYAWPIKALDNNNELSVRFYFWAGTGPSEDANTDDIERLKMLSVFINSDKLRIAGVKTIIDGIPFGHTAALLEPYSDKPGVSGEFFNPPEAYREWIAAVNKLGYAVKVHCCGDAAVRLALDCFENSNTLNGQNEELRNAVEHLDIVSDHDLHRFRELGVIASVQPAHVIMGNGIYSTRAGERSKLEWNFRRMIDTGAAYSIGTDSPVVDIDPIITIYKAVTRKDLDGVECSPYTKGQEMTLPEALKGYTLGSAYASNMEHKTGTLEAGKYADIAVINKNLFAISADEIKECHVVCTVFNGQIVYER